ncbi:MAG: mechanosensitive ion channel family protein [Treponema sp.]|jgi:small-conductance mechanosensitive channel|nr:mechanosensitive ion channel family protein [Treponema sp.]
MRLWNTRKAVFLSALTVVFFLVPFYIPALGNQEAGQTPQVQSIQEEQTEPEGENLIDATEEMTSGLTMFMENTHMNLLIRFGIAAAIIILQILLIRLMWRLFVWLNQKVTVLGTEKFKPLNIKQYRIMDTNQMLSVAYFLLKILKWVVTIFQLFLTIPIVFSLFPLTRNLASTIFSYILNPLKNIVLAIVGYIPNLFTIVIVAVVIQYIIRFLKFFTIQIEKEKLVIPGFYADWAQPTFSLLRVLLYAFMLAIIYPSLPGSDSAAFQGISVFVGILFSLGSTSAIGNLVAGIVITYMRPFKLGDRIKINDVTGFVVEKSATVTRIRTHKNEFVTFPNQVILNANITNYNFSTEMAEGLILHTDVTMEFYIPWRQVHEVMLAAGKKTIYVEETPAPYILQTALDDYYAKYELNVYVKEVSKVPAILSDLHKNLQDGFKEAGLDLTSPSYNVRLPPPDAQLRRVVPAP